MKLDGKVIVVTGAGRGIGRAIAIRCAAEGAKVALVSRTETQLATVADEISKAGGIALPVPADVTDGPAVDRMVTRVEEGLGPVDVLICNAGSFYSIGPLWETEPEAWWRDVTINLRGIYLCCRAVIPGMIRRGSGRLINLIGGGTGGPFPYGSGYATSKAGVMRLTECLAMELKDHGIPAFAMGPGLVRTVLTEFQLRSEEGKRWMSRIADLFAEGADVPPTLAANLAAELASGRFDALSGRAFNVTDDLDGVWNQKEEILAKDLRTLRMR